MFNFIEKRNKKNSILKFLNELISVHDIPILDIDIYLKSSRFIISKSNSKNGCFSGYDNAIYLNENLNEEDLKKVLMHEYGHVIDLFIGLNEESLIKKNHYFYSDVRILENKELKKELERLFNKKHSKTSIPYYLTNEEYFAELFAQYIMGEPLEKECKKILFEYIGKYKEYYYQHKKNESKYYNGLKHLNLYDMLNIKDGLKN